MGRTLTADVCILGVALVALSVGAVAQTPSVVTGEVEISAGLGGFGGSLDVVDSFGFSSARLGDLDGDGVHDLAVGANLDDDGGTFTGALWILFMNADGSVRAEQKISASEGGFVGPVAPFDRFGSSVVDVGDLDGDGVLDLVAGSNFGDNATGEVFTLFLNADGTVKSSVVIGNSSGGMAGQLSPGGRFGRSATALGDLDGDGVNDIAIGAWKDGTGAVWILFMKADGTVKNSVRIADGVGGLPVSPAFNFGVAVANIGDVDGDGVVDIAVGANTADSLRGEVWIVFLNGNGTVRDAERIALGDGGFEGALKAGDRFGSALTAIPDRDGNGVAELAVGAVFDDDGGSNHGAAWVLFLEPDGTVNGHQKISDTAGTFEGTLTTDAFFGASLASTDFDGDGRSELVIGASNDNDFINPPQTGSIWVTSLNEALWIDRGLGHPGSSGAHVFDGGGTLVPGSDFRISISNALPEALANGVAALVIGGSQINAPYKGGVLVPSPDFVDIFSTVFAFEKLELLGTWPAGAPSGSDFVFQWWVIDASIPFGASASNGLTATVP